MACIVALALFCLAFVAGCGGSTDLAESGSAASDLAESDSQDPATSDESAPTPMTDPTPTSAPPATTAPTATSVPTAAPTTVPTATPAVTSAPSPIGGLGPMSQDAFAAEWVRFSEIVAEDDPGRQAPLELPDAASATYEELDLATYPISDGVLLATSLAGDSIDGYVLLFDSDNPDAFHSLVPLGLSIGEVLALGSVIDSIYLGDPFVEPDVAKAFMGESHGLELLRTGADPVNDPLWMFSAVPNESSVSHDSLRRAAAQAARDTF